MTLALVWSSLIVEMNENLCYSKMVVVLRGLQSGWVASFYEPRPVGNPPCPRCNKGRARKKHRKGRKPVFDFRCSYCKSIFNAWTGTTFQGTQRRPSELVLLVWSVLNDVPNSRLSREFGWNRSWLVKLRRRLKCADWLRGLRNKNELDKLIPARTRARLIPLTDVAYLD